MDYSFTAVAHQHYHVYRPGEYLGHSRQMMPALGLTDLQMGQIFSAFVFGYALFQIPGGWLGDRWGARRVLTFAVIWWSIFTALTAIAPTLPVINMIGIMGSLMLVRFLIGVG